jgi:hypothetical protein
MPFQDLRGVFEYFLTDVLCPLIIIQNSGVKVEGRDSY